MASLWLLGWRRALPTFGIVMLAFLLPLAIGKEAASVGKGGKGGRHGKHKPAGQGGGKNMAKKLGLQDGTLALIEGCPYLMEMPYIRSLPRIQDDLVLLDSQYGLRCRSKPQGPIDRFGIVPREEAQSVLRTYDDKVWSENAFRQNKFHVHKDTQSVMLLWKENLTSEILEYPRWKVWEPIFQPALKLVCDKHGYNLDEVDVWKAMLARLRPGASILPHKDTNPALAVPHRVHWVLDTQSGKVDTTIAGETLDLEPGLVFDWNNVQQHSVVNRGDTWRVHAVLDVMPKKSAPRRLVRRLDEKGLNEELNKGHRNEL